VVTVVTVGSVPGGEPAAHAILSPSQLGYTGSFGRLFGGNKAETATMLPVINAFKAAHDLTDVTVVADAGMISEANQVALQAAGLSYILGARIPYLPDVQIAWIKAEKTLLGSFLAACIIAFPAVSLYVRLANKLGSRIMEEHHERGATLADALLDLVAVRDAVKRRIRAWRARENDSTFCRRDHQRCQRIGPLSGDAVAMQGVAKRKLPKLEDLAGGVAGRRN